MRRLTNIILNTLLSATLAGCATTAQHQPVSGKPYLRDDVLVPFSMRSKYGPKITLWGHDSDGDGYLDDNEVIQVTPQGVAINEALQLRNRTNGQNNPRYR
ncbi:MAG: hypothetical protein KKG75_02245 [Nanoarchaeota archaeon]|nr:hypothetical protein [Nanoarchaeota archaeon]